MSFWSRNKNKKETTSDKQGPVINTAPAPPSTLASAQNGSLPSPSTSSHSYNSSKTANGVNTTSPPSSPSTATGSKAPTTTNGAAAPFPWSMRKLRNVNPFPRFGHAANAAAGKEGEVYVFGGLVKEKRKNDLFVIDSGSMTAYNISVAGDGPSPRLGHASILVGNAFIVFGGECATTDLSHDDSLYLLNTSTRQWTRAVTVGPRPAPRYGHTLNILGSRLLVFGGQVDGYYFNDLVTFDLNTLSSPNARWELVQAVTDPPSARTGHVCMSLGDKLVIFGGTDGLQWFNDTWFFDARSNSWVEVDCIGHIPSPREGHAAAFVGDVMYIFGGRGSDGKMLSDLYAFKVSSRRWFSFQSMGAGPSARCGHTLTTSRDKIIVLGGESSTTVAGKDESTVAFILDTSKIRFPTDPNSSARPGSSKERSRNITSPTPQGFSDRSRPSSRGTNVMSPTGSGEARESPRMPTEEPPPPGSRGGRINASRVRSPSPIKGGSLPSRGSSENRGGRHSRSNSGNGSGSSIPHTGSLRIRATSPLNPHIGGMATSIQPLDTRPLNSKQSQPRQIQSPQVNEMESDPYESRSRDPHSREVSLDTSEKHKVEDMESTRSTTGDQSPDEPKHSETHHDEMSSTTPQSNPPVDLNSVEELKKKLAWATTELALAQSKGYTIEKIDEEDDIADILGKDNIQVKDTRLLQALLSTRHQLSRVKDLVKDQTRTASERISEAERQRDEALSEAAYSRARLAAAQSGDEEGGSIALNDRATELSRKLVTALSIQNELSMKVDDLTLQLTAEKRERKVAEDNAMKHLSKFDDAEQRRQEGWSQLEDIRAKFNEAQRLATDERVKSVDREAFANNLKIETEELKKQVAELTELVESQTTAVQTTKAAIASATQRAENAENALNAERVQRRELEREIVRLKQELTSLEAEKSRIEDLEVQLDHAREEADAARNVMLKGLDNLVYRSASTNNNLDYDSRLRSLQDHLEATKTLHTESREAHENATQELLKAHERITALEQAQAQSVREASNLQTRLSESLEQLSSLQEEHTKVRSRMVDVQRDLDASDVKHSAVKQLFSERPSTASPLRSMTATPEFSNKIRDLERQLEDSQRLREELEMSQEQVMQNLSVASKRHKDATRRQREAEERVKKLEEELERASAPSVSGSSTADVAEATRRQLEAEKKLADSTVVFQDRLAQLEADYQSAVHYVKGTEKMIRRMKEELTKYKSQNAFLQTELHELKRQSLKGTDEEVQTWEGEKERLTKEIEALQLAHKTDSESAAEQIKSVQAKLDQHAEERDALKSQLDAVQKDLHKSSIRTQELEGELLRINRYDDKSQLESDLAAAKAASKRLEQENQQLETRALEAEEKVSLLLDQVENSVDTYRRSVVPKRSDGNSPPISPRSSSVGNRTSVALDSLAHELDQLRSHWESSTHRYRLSTASSLGHESPTSRAHGLGLMPSFDFESHRTVDDSDRRVNGVHHPSESRWRDDAEAQPSRMRQVTA